MKTSSCNLQPPAKSGSGDEPKASIGPENSVGNETERAVPVEVRPGEEDSWVTLHLVFHDPQEEALLTQICDIGRDMCRRLALVAHEVDPRYAEKNALLAITALGTLETLVATLDQFRHGKTEIREYQEAVRRSPADTPFREWEVLKKADALMDDYLDLHVEPLNNTAKICRQRAIEFQDEPSPSAGARRRRMGPDKSDWSDRFTLLGNKLEREGAKLLQFIFKRRELLSG